MLSKKQFNALSEKFELGNIIGVLEKYPESIILDFTLKNKNENDEYFYRLRNFNDGAKKKYDIEFNYNSHPEIIICKNYKYPDDKSLFQITNNIQEYINDFNSILNEYIFNLYWFVKFFTDYNSHISCDVDFGLCKIEEKLSSLNVLEKIQNIMHLDNQFIQ